MSTMLWECVCWGALGLGLGGLWHGRRAYERACATLEEANGVFQESLDMRRATNDLLAEAVGQEPSKAEDT